jgi:hypothetical protein
VKARSKWNLSAAYCRDERRYLTLGSTAEFQSPLREAPPGANHGSDVDDQGMGTVTEQRLYQLVRQSGPIADRQVEIECLDSGVETFAFTFG